MIYYRIRCCYTELNIWQPLLNHLNKKYAVIEGNCNLSYFRWIIFVQSSFSYWFIVVLMMIQSNMV